MGARAGNPCDVNQNVTRAVNSRVHYRRLNDRLEGLDGGNRAPSWSPN